MSELFACALRIYLSYSPSFNRCQKSTGTILFIGIMLFADLTGLHGYWFDSVTDQKTKRCSSKQTTGRFGLYIQPEIRSIAARKACVILPITHCRFKWGLSSFLRMRPISVWGNGVNIPVQPLFRPTQAPLAISFWERRCKPIWARNPINLFGTTGTGFIG